MIFGMIIYIMAFVIFFIETIILVLAKVGMKKSEVIYEMKRNTYRFDRLLSNFGLFIIFYFIIFSEPDLFLSSALVTLVILPAFSELLKFLTLRKITSDGIFLITKNYYWKDILKWEWKENTLCLDVKKKFRIIGPIFDYIEVVVPKEKMNEVDEVLRKHFNSTEVERSITIE